MYIEMRDQLENRDGKKKTNWIECSHVGNVGERWICAKHQADHLRRWKEEELEEYS